MARSWGGEYQRPPRNHPQRGGSEGKSCMVAIANFALCVLLVRRLFR